MNIQRFNFQQDWSNSFAAINAVSIRYQSMGIQHQKRSWPLLQFRLSTALLLMFVVGGIMYVNWRESPCYWIEFDGDFGHRRFALTRGWPFEFVVRSADEYEYDERVNGFIGIRGPDGLPGATELPMGMFYSSKFCFESLAENVGIGLAVVVAAGILFECCLRKCSDIRNRF